MAKQALSIKAILNECQKGFAEQKKYANALWNACISQGEPAVAELMECLLRWVTTEEASASTERVVRFVGYFVATMPAGQARPTAEGIVESILLFMAQYIGCVDKLCRYRVCQLVQTVLSQLPLDVEVSEDVADAVRDEMLQRLADKVPKIRCQAVTALNRLPYADERMQYTSDPVVAGYRSLLGREKSADVRAAIVASLPIADDTVQDVVDRTLDVSSDVRRAAYGSLQRVPAQALSIAHRAQLLARGLRDRHKDGRDAASKLLCYWHASCCGGDVLELLRLLDVELHAEEAGLAVQALITAGVFNPVEYITAASAAKACPREWARKAAAAGAAGAAATSDGCPLEALVSPEEALLWQLLAGWLHDGALLKGLAAAATSGAAAAVEAAAASNLHDILDAALPDSADELCALLALHVSGGQQHRFAACALLKVAATCSDWTDGVSRASAASLLSHLLALRPGGEDDDDGSGLALLGAGGDGRFEAAVLDLGRAVHSTDADFAAAVMTDLAAVAAAWGLQQQQQQAAAGASNEAEWVQWLGYMRGVQQRLGSLPHGAVGSQLQQAHDNVLLVGARHPSPAVREAAVTCIGLYSLLPGASRVALATAVPLLHSVATHDAPSVQRPAVQALCDLMLMYGPAALDALRGAAAAVAGGSGGSVADLTQQMARAGLGSANNAAAAAGAPAAADDSLVQMLLCKLMAVVNGNGAAAAAAGARRGGKRGGAAAAAQQQRQQQEALAASLAEGLSKLLMHHHMLAQLSGPGGLPLGVAPAELPQLLCALLLLAVHPATETMAPLRQCLTVFLEAYAKVCSDHKRQLAAAFLPAVRQALSLGGSTKKSPAPTLAKYVLALLQLPLAPKAGGQQQTTTTAGDGGNAELLAELMADRVKRQQQQQQEVGEDEEGEDYGHEELAELLLAEVRVTLELPSKHFKAVPKLKAYCTELAKALCGLSLRRSQQGAIKRAAAMLEALQQRVRSASSAGVADAALSKSVSSFASSLAALEQPGSVPLSDDEMEDYMRRMEGRLNEVHELAEAMGLVAASGEEEDDDDDDKGDSDGEYEAAATAASKGRRKRASAGTKAGDEEEDADDEEEEEEEAPRARCARPARRSAPVSYVEKEDDQDEESDDDDSGDEEEKEEDGGQEDEVDQKKRPAARKAAAAAVAKGRRRSRASGADEEEEKEEDRQDEDGMEDQVEKQAPKKVAAKRSSAAAKASSKAAPARTTKAAAASGTRASSRKSG